MTLADRIVFIDDDAIVIDKPAGLPVDTPRRGGDSVASRAAELRCGNRSSPVAVNRLDQDTSGCLLLARTKAAHGDLQRSFESGNVQKIYLAVVDAEVEGEDGTIALPLAKRSTKEAGWRMVVDRTGKEAVTKWSRMEVRGGRSLIRFEPITGRTHQIRVHAREAFGAGVVGDPVYGTPGGPMLLHSTRLSLAYGDAWSWKVDAVATLPDHFGEWRIDPADVERDKQRLAGHLTYRDWEHDLWNVVLENVDRPLFAETSRLARPLIGAAEPFLEECYYANGALEPLVARFGRYHFTIGGDFQRLLPHLAAAGRADLMEKLWNSVTRRARAKYHSDRQELRKDHALLAFSEAVDWLTRVGSTELAAEMARAGEDLRDGRFPEVAAVSDARKIDEQVFWDLIARAGAQAEMTEEQVALLGEQLRAFAAADIKRFAAIYGKAMKQLYHWNVWALAYAARGGCSDDAFMEFRTWLILQGDPALLDLAVKDPATAAARVPKDPELPDGTLLPAIDEAYLARAKGSFEWPMIDLEKPKGSEWPEDQLAARFPELVRHYAA